MSKRILVVEDQPDNRQIIRDMLAPTGYEITEVENGEEALAAVAKQRPDLILMDIQLPVMDGYEATRQIKADPDLRSIPIIAVTSYAIIFPDGLLVNHRELIVELAARYRLPAMYPFRVFPEVGGLLSYGPDWKAIFRRSAEYVDKILRGARPADLPVQAPTELEFVINLKAAQALGLTVSPRLQIAANELIQ
jgi:hypothetical protein